MEQTIKINKLISKGVIIPNPISIEIGKEVDINNISSDGVIIHSGCKIFGASTLIFSGVELGSEAPVTIDECKLGCNVKLKGGYFNNSIFMEGVAAGSGSHVRSGTILEEYVTIAHSVGLKQTILFPFVKVGSLVNFCDCFMSGGTSNKNHSEVGSSYVHFNYTPNQDKATPSLIGDVAHGVMLNQNPIFLGGQGGLVGPCRIAYGTIIGAGSVYRKDQLKQNRLVVANFMRGGSMKHSFGVYRSVGRQALNNIIYIANLLALMCWYRTIRALFVTDGFSMLFFMALLETLESIIKECVHRFEVFCGKLKESADLCKNLLNLSDCLLLMQQKKELHGNRHIINDIVYQFLDEINIGTRVHSKFVSSFANQISKKDYQYLSAIKDLNPDLITSGTVWLQEIVEEVVNKFLNIFPSIGK